MIIQGTAIIGTTVSSSAATVAPNLEVSRSLRFNSADTARLNKTFSTNGTGGGITVTFSAWVKRAALSSFQSLIGADSTAGTSAYFGFNSSNNLEFGQGATIYRVTNGLFRDPSAWYHVVLVWDSSNATDALRCRIYVNGTLQTYSTSLSITLNTTQAIGLARAQGLGADTPTSGDRNYFNGYMTEINFIDGQALEPSSFGETDTATGVWEPKAYTGTYGTNGFYLKFADNSGTTSTTLGKDSSGNSNNWTPNNFSVTAGAGNDSLVDSPTNYGTDTGAGGEVRGNYCTWNPLAKSAAVVLSNGNLGGSSDASLTGGCSGTIAVTSGKWYWETTIITFDGASAHGILKLPATNYATSEPGSYKYLNGGDVRIGDGSNVPYGASYGAGDVVGVALDLDNGKVFFSKNGVFQNSGNPVSGTNPAFSSLSGEFTAWCQDGSFTQIDTWATNFGQRPFAYTAPSGFKALCTQNLPTPTIGATSTTQATDYFNAVLYTGTGATQSVTGVGFQPDLVWVKGRSGTTNHGLYDAVRGVQKQLESSTTTAETTQTTGITAFESDGFTMGSLAQLNTNAATYVAWNWKANGAGVTNTAGTITSTVSANTTAGFSIVTYSITNASSTISTFGHGLAVAPAMVILKVRNSVDEWTVYHNAISSPNSNWLTLNTTNAAGGSTSTFSSSSTTFGVRETRIIAAGLSGDIVAYCFAPISGFSTMNSYTGNGSTDGPFVFLNYRPAFLLVKRTDTTSNWTILDFQREGYNVDNDPLFPNSTAAETTTDLADLLSNGFKLRTTDASVNASGGTYVYMSLAFNPFKYARAR